MTVRRALCISFLTLEEEYPLFLFYFIDASTHPNLQGVFKCKLEFPPNYPFEPPTMRFCSEFWHPNVYKDGKVCISILHMPDPMNPEENGQYVGPKRLFLGVWIWVSLVASLLKCLQKLDTGTAG
jgi:ubiquitin-protein ligase